MVTEIMGFLILLGAAIVFIVRWQSKKEQHPAEAQQEMQYATYQFKQELEKTGSEITSRIEQHVMHLEQLIHEADRSKSILDGRLAELRELVRLGEEQMDALHTLRSEILEARQLRQQLMEAGKQASAMMQQSSVASERVDTRRFSEVLQQSMEGDRYQQETPSYSVQLGSSAPVVQPHAFEPVAPAHPARQMPDAGQAGEAVYETDMSSDEEKTVEGETAAVITDSARVRTLLLNGWSVEDVARETGMGKGAVALMKEMLRRQMGDDTVAE